MDLFAVFAAALMYLVGHAIGLRGVLWVWRCVSWRQTVKLWRGLVAFAIDTFRCQFCVCCQRHFTADVGAASCYVGERVGLADNFLL